MLCHYLVLLLISTFAVIPSNLSAQPSPKYKSIAISTALGLSPIPGDGLIYADSKIIGITDLSLGLVGWTLTGIALGKCNDLDDCNFPAMDVIAAGLALIGITYLVDAIGAPIAGLDYNRKHQTVQPFVRLEQNRYGGKVVGMSFGF